MHLANSRRTFLKLVQKARTFDEKQAQALIKDRNYAALDQMVLEHLMGNCACFAFFAPQGRRKPPALSVNLAGRSPLPGPKGFCRLAQTNISPTIGPTES